MSKAVPLKAPYPAFGGKSRVASQVWDRLGDCVNFIEPFANSAAVLLARPHAPKIETVNDLNSYIANFWRAVKADPEAVVGHADYPVNEADLHARHRWLVLSAESEEFRKRMKVDPDYFDAKIAGWWVWGACCWIGSGWCDTPESAEWQKVPSAPIEQSVHLSSMKEGYSGMGVHATRPSQKRPNISGFENEHGERTHHGHGVHAKVPSEKRPRAPRANGNSEGGYSQGIHAENGPSEQIPTLEMCRTGGKGVNGVGPSETHRPQLADVYARGRGVHANDSAGTCAQRRAWLLDWFGRLSDRLRTVRVCCGHWKRVCDSFSVTTRLGTTGVFLDAPYKTHLADGTSNRSADLYANDRTQDVNGLVDEVIAYCVERGSDPLMRIAACCYEGEGYEVLAELGWECLEWKAGGGYANRNKTGSDNAARERIYFSPACQKPKKDHMPLFDQPESL